MTLLRAPACAPLPDVAALPPAARSLLAAAPRDPLVVCGPPHLLGLPFVALLASTTAPPALVLPAHDLARDLRDRGVGVVGGFHSPLERDALAFLLRGEQPLVVCPARALEGMRLPRAWRGPLAAGRLLLASTVRPGRRRPTTRMAEARNRLAAALAERVFVVHAAPGGAVYRLARECLARGQPVHCFDHPANRDLVLMGAEAVGW